MKLCPCEVASSKISSKLLPCPHSAAGYRAFAGRIVFVSQINLPALTGITKRPRAPARSWFACWPGPGPPVLCTRPRRRACSPSPFDARHKGWSDSPYCTFSTRSTAHTLTLSHSHTLTHWTVSERLLIHGTRGQAHFARSFLFNEYTGVYARLLLIRVKPRKSWRCRRLTEVTRASTRVYHVVGDVSPHHHVRSTSPALPRSHGYHTSPNRAGITTLLRVAPRPERGSAAGERGNLWDRGIVRAKERSCHRSGAARKPNPQLKEKLSGRPPGLESPSSTPQCAP